MEKFFAHPEVISDEPTEFRSDSFINAACQAAPAEEENAVMLDVCEELWSQQIPEKSSSIIGAG